MRVILFAKIFALFSAFALLAVFLTPYLIPESGKVDYLFRAMQYEALAVALAIIATAVYPNVFGVQKGEKVLLVTTDPITNRMIISLVTALENKKLNENIKIKMSDGNTAEGIIESYPGLISPARITMKPEQNLKVI